MHFASLLQAITVSEVKAMREATLGTKPRTFAMLIKEHSCRPTLGGLECRRMDQSYLYIVRKRSKKDLLRK